MVAKCIGLTPDLWRDRQGAERMREASLARRVDGLEMRHMLRRDHHGAVAVVCFVRDAKFHKQCLNLRQRYVVLHHCVRKINCSADPKHFALFAGNG